MGEKGRTALLDHFEKLRFTIAPRTTVTGPRDEAELIIESFTHVGAQAAIEKALIRMIDGDDPAVAGWALRKIIDWNEPSSSTLSSSVKYGLPIPFAKCAALLAEDGPDPGYPSGRARAAAGYLSKCLAEPRACKACLEQFEQRRFIDIFLHNWTRIGRYPLSASMTFSFDYAKGMAGLRKRMRDVALTLSEPKQFRRPGWERKHRLIALLGGVSDGYDPAKREEAVLRRLEGIMLEDRHEDVRALAAAAYGRLTEYHDRARAFDVFSGAAEKELERGKQNDRQEALVKIVYHIPRTLGKDPAPVLLKVATSAPTDWPRKEATGRLTQFGRLPGAWPLLTKGKPDTESSLYYGFHLLPTAAEKANGADLEAVNTALGAILRLANYPEKHRKYHRHWRGVEPDEESAALAELALKRCVPGVLKRLDSAELRVSRYDCDVVRKLRIQEAIPALADGRSPAETLSHLTLPNEHYTPLFKRAMKGDFYALRAISGTADKRAADLYPVWSGKSAGARYWLAKALLRSGDVRGLALCRELGKASIHFSSNEQALRAMGLLRTERAAQEVVAFVNEYSYHSNAAADALVAIGRPAVPVILKALTDPAWPHGGREYYEGKRRGALVRALGEIGDDRAVPILVWLCGRKNDHGALAALMQINTKTARDAVFALAQKGRVEPSWQMFGSLAECFRGDPRAAELYTLLAEQAPPDSSARGYGACLAARFTRTPERTRERLYRLWTGAKKEYYRKEITKALSWLGEKRVAAEAFPYAAYGGYPTVAGLEMKWDFDAIVRLDRDGLIRYAKKQAASDDPATRRLGLRLIARLGVLKPAEVDASPYGKELRKMLDVPKTNDRSFAASLLAQLKAPGIVKELNRRMNRSLSLGSVVDALGENGTDEAAEVLVGLLDDPARRAEFTRSDYWQYLKALRQNGRPKAMRALRGLLYKDLAGQDVPRSRRALGMLAEVARGGLRDKLLDFAASATGHLRCLCVYGLMKHFGYKGPYDPFESGPKLKRMAEDLRAHVRATE